MPRKAATLPPAVPRASLDATKDALIASIQKKIDSGKEISRGELEGMRTIITAGTRQHRHGIEEIKRQLLELELETRKGLLLKRESVDAALNAIRKTSVEAITVMRESLPPPGSMVPVADVLDELTRYERTMQRMAETTELEGPE